MVAVGTNSKSLNPRDERRHGEPGRGETRPMSAQQGSASNTHGEPTRPRPHITEETDGVDLAADQRPGDLSEGDVAGDIGVASAAS